jgi:hypothetical protein
MPLQSRKKVKSTSVSHMSSRGHKAVPGVVPQDSGIGHSAANLGSELAQGTSLGQRNTTIGMQHVEAVIKSLDQLSFEEEL